MSEAFDRELQLMRVRTRVMKTRLPSVIVGTFGVLGFLAALVLAVMGLFEVGLHPGAIIPMLMLAAFLAIYIVPPLILLYAGIEGYRATRDPRHIVSQARAMVWFWRITALYLVGWFIFNFSIFALMLLGGGLLM